MATENTNIAFQGEVQLLRWSDTSNGGATITLALADHADLERFKLMTIKKGQQAGQRLACVMVEIGDDEKPVTQPVTEGAHGRHYTVLYRVGWWNNPRVRAAMGFAGPSPVPTDEMKAYLSKLFGVTSLSQVAPSRFINAMKEHRIADTLPREFGQ